MDLGGPTRAVGKTTRDDVDVHPYHSSKSHTLSSQGRVSALPGPGFSAQPSCESLHRRQSHHPRRSTALQQTPHTPVRARPPVTACGLRARGRKAQVRSGCTSCCRLSAGSREAQSSILGFTPPSSLQQLQHLRQLELRELGAYSALTGGVAEIDVCNAAGRRFSRTIGHPRLRGQHHLRTTGACGPQRLDQSPGPNPTQMGTVRGGAEWAGGSSRCVAQRRSATGVVRCRRNLLGSQARCRPKHPLWWMRFAWMRPLRCERRSGGRRLSLCRDGSVHCKCFIVAVSRTTRRANVHSLRVSGRWLVLVNLTVCPVLKHMPEPSLSFPSLALV